MDTRGWSFRACPKEGGALGRSANATDAPSGFIRTSGSGSSAILRKAILCAAGGSLTGSVYGSACSSVWCMAGIASNGGACSFCARRRKRPLCIRVCTFAASFARNF